MAENIVLTGIVMGLCQLVKIYVNSRWIPLIALVLGIGGSFLLNTGGDVYKNVLEGVISGLVAVGLYSGTKNTIS